MLLQVCCPAVISSLERGVGETPPSIKPAHLVAVVTISIHPSTVLQETRTVQGKQRESTQVPCFLSATLLIIVEQLDFAAGLE